MALIESYIFTSGAAVDKKGSGWETRNCGFTNSGSFGVIIFGNCKHMCRFTISFLYITGLLLIILKVLVASLGLHYNIFNVH